MEKPVHEKCHKCGGAARYAYAFARFGERETFLGLIHRGVCSDCLNEHIDAVIHARRNRYEGLLWLAVFLPVGGLLAAFARRAFWQGLGFVLIALAVALPLITRAMQLREARRAQAASWAENAARYSVQICQEDAMRTSRQTMLVRLRPEFAEAGYSLAKIAEEFGVSEQTAELIRSLSQRVLAVLITDAITENG